MMDGQRRDQHAAVDPSMMVDDSREDSLQLLSDDEEGGSRKLHKGETQEERDKKRRAFKACKWMQNVVYALSCLLSC
jgi:hypothetical protein